MTAKGRIAFEAMAREHEGWILELFGQSDPRGLRQLHQQLGALRVHVAALLQAPPEGEET